MTNTNNTIDNKLYNATATSQVVAHDMTKASLMKCVHEVAKKIPGTLRMCDLGSAGGVNALTLLGCNFTIRAPLGIVGCSDIRLSHRPPRSKKKRF